MINLPNDDPSAEREMIYYLYNLDLIGHEFISENATSLKKSCRKLNTRKLLEKRVTDS
jgi:hypothetical protein